MREHAWESDDSRSITRVRYVAESTKTSIRIYTTDVHVHVESLFQIYKKVVNAAAVFVRCRASYKNAAYVFRWLKFTVL